MPTPARQGPPTRAAVVVLAAGEGRRTGSRTNKVLLPLAGREVFTWSVARARELSCVTRTVVVVREQDRTAIEAALTRVVGPPPVEVVTGGDTRHASEWAALRLLAPAIESGDVDVVAIHDGARPLAGAGLWADVIETAAREGGAIPATAQGHLVTLVAGEPLPEGVVAVQTPQAFRARPLLEAYRRAEVDGFVGTDTASCVEQYAAVPVHRVGGDPANLKITFPDDLALAERLLSEE